ncbi:MAG: outer membrane protein assembly factor BamD [Deltaproteobacteria bacterium]|nr:outer membrane protein assembly factor BamD [Deltaproteobacteria bacterium]
MSSESPIAAPVASSSASIMQDERDAIAALYASGVTAFQAGDYAGAERQLRRFAARAPADSRGEDAAFLIALARARRGDSVGAASSAREYLHRFPHGLRRREAEQLVSPAGSN